MRSGRRGFPAGFECIFSPGRVFRSVREERASRFYGADALAWTALKSGRIAEALAAGKDALRLGTLDARLFYHAGMIARAASDKKTAGEFLRRALSLNPHFDPLQSESARKALQELQIP